MTPRVVEVRPRATDAEVAAIAAAIACAVAQPEAGASEPGNPGRLEAWVHASRRSAQRANLQRGPWRLSGRIGRRSRS